MPLSNVALREAIDDNRLYITPKPRFPEDYDTDAVHLHIGNVFYELRPGVRYVWDPQKETITQFWQRQLKSGNAKKIVLKLGQAFWLKPGRVALAETKEVVGLPLRHRKRWGDKKLLSGKFSGRSRYARAFVGVHITADIFHPGSHGTKAAELHNPGQIEVPFRPGDAAFQLQCEEVTGEIIATENFANGQTSAIGEGSNDTVVVLATHPKFAGRNRQTYKHNRRRATGNDRRRWK